MKKIEIEDIMNFNDLNLSKPVLDMLKSRKFLQASEIQEKAIPEILSGKDIVGLSQTGTGKTLAFLLPILEKLDKNSSSLQALVLCPTRELAQQIRQEVKDSSIFLSNVRSVAVYGGADIRQQIFALKKQPNIVIGTPGRILDHIKRHTLKLGGVRFLVLDEADEMFNMGFRKDIVEIIEKTPDERQTLLFSATMNNEVLEISKNYMKNPEIIKVGKENSSIEKIRQTYFLIPKDKKKKALHSLLCELEKGKTLIFCNTKTMVNNVEVYLEKMGFKVEALHGDMPQPQRTRVMKDFKNGNFEILITTDVSARGIDVSDILNVVNFDLPQNPEYYVHRIGRTARAGKEGNAWTILNDKEQERKLKEIEKKTNSKIKLSYLELSHIDEIKQSGKSTLNENRNLKNKKGFKNLQKSIGKQNKESTPARTQKDNVKKEQNFKKQFKDTKKYNSKEQYKRKTNKQNSGKRIYV